MSKRRKADILGAIDRLAKAEEAFVGSEFLAPVLRGAGVGVKIGDVRCRLKVSPKAFEGWGVFKAVSFDRAKYVRDASMGERRKYRALFPAVRLILAMSENDQWLAIAANSGDARFAIDGLVPPRFVEDAELFETIVTHFDGTQFWFDAGDTRADPGAAAYLRESLQKMLDPKLLVRSSLTAEQRMAYVLNYTMRQEAIEAEERAKPEARLKRALSHAGAELRDFSERPDVYRVSYDVDGQRHTSVVRKNNLAVVTAGICLSGRDDDFDLGSLIGVLREGEDAGRIVRLH
ncbi:MAG: hypothetical protein JWN40_1528 [Phycisphaerales bacterium]|nr:hypothetical protein [Phycisphaerales bacterium]